MNKQPIKIAWIMEMTTLTCACHDTTTLSSMRFTVLC